MNQRSKLAAAAAAGAPADDGEVREGAARRRRAPGVRTLVGGQRWWMAAVFGRLWPSTRVLVGAGLRGEREGGGIRRRRWGFGNGAFARLLCLCVLQSAPVAPRCEQLCALLVADFGRMDHSEWNHEELFGCKAL